MQKPPCTYSLRRNNTHSVVLLVGAVIVGVPVDVVVPEAAPLVEDLDAHVPVAEVGEHEDEAGLEAVVPRELLPADVEVHLAARVVDHVDDPPVVAARSLP